MTEEIWKRIKDSNDGEVSNLGRVRRNGIIVEPHYDPEGYPRCSVGGVGRKRIHEFVAEAFLIKNNTADKIDHIDRDKSNNKLSNLRYVDNKTNGENAVYSKPRKEPVIGINLEAKEVKELKTQADAHRYLDINVGSGEVNKVLKGKRKETHGWTFYYKSDYKGLINGNM